MCVTTLIEDHSGFYTTPLFWDCACEEFYIRPASEEYCPVCNTRREDAPDARVNEVLCHAYEFNLPFELVRVLESAAKQVNPELAELVGIPF